MKYLLLFYVLFTSCQARQKQILNSPADSLQKQNPAKLEQPHLKDTAFIEGNAVIFLRPDSARFESYEEEDHIFEADSDFGFWISAAMDSMKRDAGLKRITPYVVTERFVKINQGPGTYKLIDRDTINYGVILISKQKGITINPGLGAGNYIGMVEDYF